MTAISFADETTEIQLICLFLSMTILKSTTARTDTRLSLLACVGVGSGNGSVEKKNRLFTMPRQSIKAYGVWGHQCQPRVYSIYCVDLYCAIETRDADASVERRNQIHNKYARQKCTQPLLVAGQLSLMKEERPRKRPSYLSFLLSVDSSGSRLRLRNERAKGVLIV